MGTTFHVRDQILTPHFGVFHEAAAWHLVSDEDERSLALDAPHMTIARHHPS
jgi:hypothetical protein